MLANLDFAAIFTASGLVMLGQIIVADLTMAGDNVLIMGTIASGLPERERKKVILLGVAIALVFLIGFALIATWLLSLTGLLLAGGLLLLWVAYNMYRELRPSTAVVADDERTEDVEGPPRSKTFLAAAIQITLADLSMSLDNVLVVAGIARENPAVLFIGLTFTVLIMGIASTFVARLIQRYHWIAWIGLVLILYVAGRMIYEGWVDPVVGLGRLFG
ncbi:MAG TPA: YjbE family putative metal transport protein [Novosphingobium sp.]|nr:YjbE family putative metal transport protein [Novosphingobium sp.]